MQVLQQVPIPCIHGVICFVDSWAVYMDIYIYISNFYFAGISIFLRWSVSM